MILLDEIRGCTFCRDKLPYPPRPVVSFSANSKILIVGQAPGLKVQKSGIPWDDASGDRLRQWLGVTKETFYNPDLFGIVPMGFCYPGKGKSGDLPPRLECSALFMDRILCEIRNWELILLIGQYAQNYFIGEPQISLTDKVKNYKKYLPEFFVLPHPSPRNNIWLEKNKWFEKNNIRDLRNKIRKIL